MAEREGVIKYVLDHRAGPALAAPEVADLCAWRRILRALGLLGQDPGRYLGLGFGNISKRVAPFDAPALQRRFIVSGSQTGALERADGRHYALVLSSDPYANRLCSQGPIEPSSEALTHATIYHVDGDVRYVMHVHDPHVWCAAEELGIAVTDRAVAYGTPEMCEQVRALHGNGATWARRIFVMGGHEDGVIAFGRTALEAGRVLIEQHARALEIDERARAVRA